MSVILSPDDFEVGMKITVHTGKTIYRNTGSIFSMFSEGGTAVASEDGYCKGQILEITSVMLPYLVVKIMNIYANQDRSFSLDTRDMSFMKITDEYEKALLEGRE